MSNIVILGSTGSIGTQTLDVIRHLSACKVLGLAAGTNLNLLRKQVQEFQPDLVSIEDSQDAGLLRDEFSVKAYSGLEGLLTLATDPRCDIVVVALVGALGLKPTLAALRAGKRVALANKETLVAAGHLVMEFKSQIVPIDSEHSALWNLFWGRDKDQISKIILTASGGPFLKHKGSLEDVTVQEALAHPRWEMGDKISIDSATLMNKGLEVIEAHWLFGFPYDKIEVVIHPESLVHSLVQLHDGSFLAHLGRADMRIPIQYALSYPQVVPSAVEPLDLTKCGPLSFLPVDRQRFPSLDLAYRAGRSGGEQPIALNAANEEAVRAFLQGELKFKEIPRLVREVTAGFSGKSFPSLEQILAIDAEARERARRLLQKY
ncbi:MAG: 1-deoxy-D-xylulose-5-phosphate reductoisomerase [Firmicutes bacterium]|nr:1-deoxy-D-xylulose-5-phosphate reductoisomerase [Bacillota bacterium]